MARKRPLDIGRVIEDLGPRFAALVTAPSDTGLGVRYAVRIRAAVDPESGATGRLISTRLHATPREAFEEALTLAEGGGVW